VPRVAFLRAVNVGRRTVKMARLAEVVTDLGYRNVWTHINSGNVVFDATGGRDALEHKLETAFEAEFGFEVTTFVRTDAELRGALALKPFPMRAGDTYFVTFLKSAASKAQKAELEALSGEFDTLVVKGRDVHWRMRGKSTDTKLATKAWDDIVGRHRSTSRNTTMLRKLIDKIDSRQ
jgi:uncharacterized protein (DUF1697 family)